LLHWIEQWYFCPHSIQRTEGMERQNLIENWNMSFHSSKMVDTAYDICLRNEHNITPTRGVPIFSWQQLKRQVASTSKYHRVIIIIIIITMVYCISFAVRVTELQSSYIYNIISITIWYNAIQTSTILSKQSI
jgi:hypothetical protein